MPSEATVGAGDEGYRSVDLHEVSLERTGLVFTS
jgi:hypothetical protein